MKKIKTDEWDSLKYFNQIQKRRMHWLRWKTKNNIDNHNRGKENSYDRGSRGKTYLCNPIKHRKNQNEEAIPLASPPIQRKKNKIK